MSPALAWDGGFSPPKNKPPLARDWVRVTKLRSSPSAHGTDSGLIATADNIIPFMLSPGAGGRFRRARRPAGRSRAVGPAGIALRRSFVRRIDKRMNGRGCPVGVRVPWLPACLAPGGSAPPFRRVVARPARASITTRAGCRRRRSHAAGSVGHRRGVGIAHQAGHADRTGAAVGGGGRRRWRPHSRRTGLSHGSVAGGEGG